MKNSSMCTKEKLVNIKKSNQSILTNRLYHLFPPQNKVLPRTAADDFPLLVSLGFRAEYEQECPRINII